MLTLRSLFEGLDRFGDEPAVTADGTTHAYRDVVGAANRLARHLIGAGIEPGVPVALMMRNRVEYVIADQALLRCGATKVPLNTMLGASELAYILEDSRAQIAIADDTMLAHAMSALHDPETVVRAVVSIDAPPEPADRPGVVSWDDAIAGQPDTLPDVEVDPDGIGALFYTGGTTGKPKGVVHLQRRLALNVMAHTIEMGLGDEERMLLTSPLPHAAGFLMHGGLVKGAHVFLDHRFDPNDVIDRIERDRLTFYFAVPTMIYRLLDRAVAVRAERELDLSSLRTLLYGAAPITPERLTQGLEVFGSVFMQLYGQSEAPDFITRLRHEDHDVTRPHLLTSCGRPCALTGVRIVDDDGTERPVREVGEAVAFTPYTMTGYHDLPEKTAETLRDGWLHTGDLGYVDEDGYLYLVDRKNDMIITGGMNVYSSEVENAIGEIHGVASAAVVGMPHPDWGEAVIAFVVGDDIAPDAVIAHCKDRLSIYKVPKAVHVVSSLPLTAVGKLDKKVLRQQAIDAAG
jgi:fatty-acyl-CoA synthase